MTNNKIRFAILSDSPFLNTGYSTQAYNYANKCAEAGMEVYYMASNYIGQDLPPGVKLKDGTEFKFWILGQGREPYFKDLIELKLKELQIDVFMVLLDSFMVFPWFTQLDFSPAKTIFMFPSDGGAGLPLGCEAILKKVDHPIAMAKFGQKQVKKMYNIDTDYIPHAVNIHNFYPLPDDKKLELRKKFGLEGKYVIGTVARNQGRKMMDRTLKSFALYAKENPNAILLLHTDPNDNAAVFPLQHMINYLGIQNRVRFTGMRFHSGFTYKQMNEVYNLMDVFLLTTSGEGFGIPLIEASACAIPTLCTDYTTTRELVKEPKAGLMIDLIGVNEDENPDAHCNEILEGTITGSWAVERGICSLKDCAKKLKILEDKKLRDELGMNGRRNVEINYSWEVVGKKFVDVITELGRKL